MATKRRAADKRLPAGQESGQRRYPRYQVRRRHPRYQVENVRGSFPRMFEVEVLNMSLTGIAVQSQRPLEVGKEYDFTLRTGDEEVELKADVQWCHLVRTERSYSEVIPIYQSGLDFRGALDEKAKELLAFLQHHIVIDADRRLFGRFSMDLEGPAKVTERHDFVVQVISFCGMLIETDRPLDVGLVLDMELRAGRRSFHLVGRVANSQLSEATEESVCHAGIAFEGIDAETGHALEEVMTDFLAE